MRKMSVSPVLLCLVLLSSGCGHNETKAPNQQVAQFLNTMQALPIAARRSYSETHTDLTAALFKSHDQQQIARFDQLMKGGK